MENTNTSLHEEVQKVLSAYNVEVINSMEEFNKLVVIEIVDGFKKFKPAPTCKTNVVIIFDNESYNSAFLHEHLDVFNKCLGNIDSLGDLYSDEIESLPQDSFERIVKSNEVTKVYYINSPELSNSIMTDFYATQLHMPFNNNSLLLFFNHEVDEVFFEAEIFSEITAKSFANIHNILNNKEAIIEMITEIEVAKDSDSE